MRQASRPPHSGVRRRNRTACDAGARGCNTLARGCGGIIPPRIKVYNSPSCGILPSTGKSLNTGRPPKRSEHGKHQIQSKRQTVFRGERKLQGAVGQAVESLQERIRREELQKLQVKFAKIKATDPVGRFDFLRTRSALSRIRSGAISLH